MEQTIEQQTIEQQTLTTEQILEQQGWNETLFKPNSIHLRDNEPYLYFNNSYGLSIEITTFDLVIEKLNSETNIWEEFMGG